MSEAPRSIQRLIDPSIKLRVWNWDSNTEPAASHPVDMMYEVILQDVCRQAVVIKSREIFSQTLDNPGTGRLELWAIGVDKNESDYPSYVSVKISLKNSQKHISEILTLPCVDTDEAPWIKYEIPVSGMKDAVECTMELVSDKDIPAQMGSHAIIGTPVFIPDQLLMQPNVIIVCIDSLRADDLGAYGSPLACSPTIDRLSQQGIVFSQSLSTSSWTIPGVKNMLAGYQTMCEQPEDAKLLPEAHFTGTLIQELYAEAGYTTLGIVANPLISTGLAFDNGFDMFDTFAVRTWFLGSTESIYDRIDQALSLHRDRPIFMYIHFMDPHDPHTPIYPFDQMLETPPDSAVREKLQERITGFLNQKPYKTEFLPLTNLENQYLRDHYRNELRETDTFLHCVLTSLNQFSHFPENTLIVITADHGEEFGEHGYYQHGITLYEAVVRVPWIMSFPPSIPVNHIETGWVSTMDIPPTLSQLTLNKKMPSWKGYPVFPKQPDYPNPRLVYTASRMTDVPTHPWERWRAAYCNEKKLMWLPSVIQGFDLELHPEERVLFDFSSFETLAADHWDAEWKALADNLAQFVDSILKKDSHGISDPLMRQLKELGYVQ